MLNQRPFMERDIITQLEDWSASPYRKPLLIKGARQTGKTRALKYFGSTHYENVAYFSLQKPQPHARSEYSEFFTSTTNPERIVQNLSLLSGQPIHPERTLLILDEIQDSPEALASLKYFCEEAPGYHVACAGSLLGVALASEVSFPVGKVTFLDLEPMTFSEFLRASGQENLDAYCKEINGFDAVPDAFSSRLQEQLRFYISVGGMPESVVRWVDTGDITQVNRVLSDLVDSYERDFAKHGGANAYTKISLIWHSLPAQLARENKKFVYGVVKEGARAREYEDAIEWLRNAGLVRKINRISKPGIPVSAYDDEHAFKLYSLDVGLLRRLAGLDASAFATSSGVFTEFKGAFAENYALQSLCSQLGNTPRYWRHDSPQHEVDFIIQTGNDVLPVEVKSGEAVHSASLRYYARKYPERTPLRVRLSMRNLSLSDGMLNIPLYLADHVVRLVDLALG